MFDTSQSSHIFKKSIVIVVLFKALIKKKFYCNNNLKTQFVDFFSFFDNIQQIYRVSKIRFNFFRIFNFLFIIFTNLNIEFTKTIRYNIEINCFNTNITRFNIATIEKISRLFII